MTKYPISESGRFVIRDCICQEVKFPTGFVINHISGVVFEHNTICHDLRSLDERYADFKRRLAAAQRRHAKDGGHK